MSDRDPSYKDPGEDRIKISDVVNRFLFLLKKAVRQLWGMTPFGEQEDAAYYSGMEDTESGKKDMAKTRFMSIGCGVYGVLFGFFSTMAFMHFSDRVVGDLPVVSTVLNTVLIMLWLASNFAVTAFIYFILKWTVVRGMGEDGLDSMQVSIMYAVLGQVIFSILSFLIF